MCLSVYVFTLVCGKLQSLRIVLFTTEAQGALRGTEIKLFFVRPYRWWGVAAEVRAAWGS